MQSRMRGRKGGVQEAGKTLQRVKDDIAVLLETIFIGV